MSPLVSKNSRVAKQSFRLDATFAASSALFLAGFLSVLSLPLFPDAERTPRTLDVIGIFATVFLLFRFWKIKTSWTGWLAGVGATLALALPLAVSITTGDTGRTIIIARIVTAIAAAIVLGGWAVRTDRITILALGMWTAAAMAMAIALGQRVGIEWLVALMPVDRSESAVSGILRASAIWGHPNAAAQVTMAAAAVILMAWKQSDGRVVLPILLYFSIAVLNYAIMLNRAPIVVGLGIVAIATIRQDNFYIKSFAVFCLCLLTAVLVSDPSVLLGERWTGTFSGMTTYDQMLERFRSTIAGIRIAFEQPFGHSVADREARMLAEIGIRASHNGFVFAALTIGPWAVIFLFAIFFGAGRNSDNGARTTALATSSICLMLLFEDALLEPAIIFCLAILAAIQFFKKRCQMLPAQIRI